MSRMNRPSILDDAYEVACTALVLLTGLNGDGHRTTDGPWQPARHASALHRISGQLHRIAVRQCNEDLNCPACHGEGFKGDPPGKAEKCRACAGEGSTVGRKLAKLRKDAEEIASHYGLRCYFQPDPLGCSLYLIDPAMIPGSADALVYGLSEEGKREQREWIDSNCNRGHAVVRLGR